MSYSSLNPQQLDHCCSEYDLQIIRVILGAKSTKSHLAFGGKNASSWVSPQIYSSALNCVLPPMDTSKS